MIERYCEKCGTKLKFNAKWTGKYNPNTGKKMFTVYVEPCPALLLDRHERGHETGGRYTGFGDDGIQFTEDDLQKFCIEKEIT